MSPAAIHYTSLVPIKKRHPFTSIKRQRDTVSITVRAVIADIKKAILHYEAMAYATRG